MVAIQWPTVTAPGRRSQDGAGRLINVFAETRPNDQGLVWRRAPGAVVFTSIRPTTASMTGTATVSFQGQGGQGTLAITCVSSVDFVGTSV